MNNLTHPALDRETWDTLTDEERYDLFTLAHDTKVRYMEFERQANLALFLLDVGQYGLLDLADHLHRAKSRLYGWDKED